MDRNKKNLSMRNYIVYIVIILLIVCGLILLLSTCTEVVIDSGGSRSDKKIAMHFTLGEVVYNGNEVVTHSQKDMGPETVVVPLGDDLNMYATLEVDQDVKLHAATTSTLAPGTLLRIVAYENGTTYRTHADYTVSSSGSGSSRELVGGPFLVSPGNYRFVAYSYNSTTTMPGHDEYTLSNIDPANDLLWGRYPEDGTFHPVTATTFEDVPITMSHAFSRLTIHATTVDIPPGNIIISNISNVSMPGKRVELTLNNGVLTPQGDVPQNFLPVSSWTGTGSSTTVTSDARTVYMGGSTTTTVQIGTLNLTGYPTYTNLTAVFDKPLQRGISYNLYVHFKKDGNIIPFDLPPTDMTLYVGAFWKANQTGERLIRIPRPSSGSADGPWTATVLVGNDWIVLDKQMTTDPNVGWLGGNEALVHNGNESYDGISFDDLHPVNSTLTTVIGNMNASEPQIYFRIGLKSALPNYPAVPARYGVVLLTYKNNSLRYRIWIRQGEGDDFLMSNATPVNTGGLTARTKTRRFTVYNLTAETLDQPVLTQIDAANSSITGNRSKFTDYPTQSGAHFQWAVSSMGQFSRVRYAWNPYSLTVPVPPSTATWWGVSPPNDLTANGFWSDLQAENETCPPGYRRPNDGAINQAEPSTNILSSELRQSLLERPKTGLSYNEDLSNSAYGYYADGFFDRRLIVAGSTSRPNRLTTVAIGTRNIAHSGRLFYNVFSGIAHANASLFFPYGGTRYYDTGNISDTFGNQTFYWTSSRTGIYPNNTPPQNLYPHILRFNDDGVAVHPGPESACGTYGTLIRCVKD